MQEIDRLSSDFDIKVPQLQENLNNTLDMLDILYQNLMHYFEVQKTGIDKMKTENFELEKQKIELLKSLREVENRLNKVKEQYKVDIGVKSGELENILRVWLVEVKSSQNLEQSI